MSNQEVVMLVGGIIALVLGAIEVLRTSAVTLSVAAIMVLGAVFVIVALI